MLFHCIFFFFSIRRRHTISLRDWSSDVCSSDLFRARSPAATPPERIVSLRSPSFTPDRKSTRLNSSHVEISYAVFCLKKKKKTTIEDTAKKRTLESRNSD